MARLVLDASAMIALLDPSDAHHTWGYDLYLNTTDDDLVLPAINFAEILVHPARLSTEGELALSLKKLRVEIRSISEEDALETARLRSKLGLKLPDTFTLQAAIAEEATLVSTDKALAKTAREYGLTVYSPSFRE